MDVHLSKSDAELASPLNLMNEICEIDMEADDNTLVTINIFEHEAMEIKEGGGVEESTYPYVQVTKGVNPPDYSMLIRESLKICLMLSSCTCNSVEKEKGSKTNDNSECTVEHTQIMCFLCSNYQSTYPKLKEHLLKDHSLSYDANLLSNSNTKLVDILANELKLVECVCSNFKCNKCTVTFKLFSPLLLHVLYEHPQSYPKITFPQNQIEDSDIKCKRCTLLGKLRVVSYNLFITVLFSIEDCCDDTYLPLLQYNSTEDIDVSDGNPHAHLGNKEDFCSSNASVEAVCYSISQKPQQFKASQEPLDQETDDSSKCICPILKCPVCPYTTSTFKDLRTHTRVNDHNAYHGLKLMWKKYKIIKDHCPSCPSYPALRYILCPHCPEITFEDETSALFHMDYEHSRKARDSTSEASQDKDSTASCICSKPFICFMCNNRYHMPQELLHHMRSFGHETVVNIDAIPRMMKRIIDDKNICPRCSLIGSRQISARKSEDQEQCSCVWAVCDTCGNSYRKISELMNHLHKTKHPLNTDYIKEQQRIVATAFKSCSRCNSIDERYCIFCNKRVNFIYYHIKTHHQDQQILLLTGDDGHPIDEFDVTYKSKDTAKYECSICLQCFVHSTILRRHVRKFHPDDYFILYCLDLSHDKQTMNNFKNREEFKVLTVASRLSELS